MQPRFSGGALDVLIFSTVIAPILSFSLHHMERERRNIKQLRYERVKCRKKEKEIRSKQIVKTDGELHKEKDRAKLCGKDSD